ncbi:hypothetical protein LguiB_005215 [Lonicera macranthoides]
MNTMMLFLSAICDAVSLSRPRTDIVYCIHSLAKRLTKTHNWAVALKILVVIHRAFREVDTAIHVEIVNYSHSRGHVLNLSHFKDDSSPNAWEYSARLRCYALYLEERLECYQMLKYDVERDHLKTKELSIPDLLDQLPVLQQLLFRLLACQGDNPSDTFSGGSASAAPGKSKMWPEQSHHDAGLHELLAVLGYKVGGVRETEVREKEA